MNIGAIAEVVNQYYEICKIITVSDKYKKLSQQAIDELVALQNQGAAANETTNTASDAIALILRNFRESQDSRGFYDWFNDHIHDFNAVLAQRHA
jgi:hypothetical protein